MADTRARRRFWPAWVVLVLAVVVGVLAIGLGEWPLLLSSVGLVVVAVSTLYAHRQARRGDLQAGEPPPSGGAG